MKAIIEANPTEALAVILAAFLIGNTVEKVFIYMDWPDRTWLPFVANVAGVVVCVLIAVRSRPA